uniref:Uncharacterized protein n=1 Tax=Chenopodium quinoa TaxID=63459 RepID=A0A803MX28_CHEQI
MAYQYFPSFKALISTGSLVEDAIKKGEIKKEDFNNGNSYSSRFGANKKITNNVASASKPTNMIYNIGATSAFQLRPQRQFTPLNMTDTQAFSKLKKANLIQPLNPRPPPRNPPPTCLDNELASHRIIKIRGHNYTLRKDPFAMMCGAIDYDNAYFILDHEEDEDDASVMAIVERNTGAYFSTPNNYSHPICLDDLSDDEVVEVSHLTRAGRHFKPSYLEEDNPLDALRRKEKGKELMVDEVNIEDDAIKQMKEVNAHISIWKLLMHSQPHRSAVLKHLNEASVDPSITLDQIVGLIHGVDRTLMFTDEDLPEARPYKNKGICMCNPATEVNMKRYCSYCSQFGHTTDSCYDLRCSIQDLIDRRIIDPIHTRPRTGHNLVRRFSSQQWSSQSAIFRGLLDEGAIKPLPRRTGASPIGVDLHKYCHYHLHGHDTDGCHALRLRIKHITKISHLSRKRSISINVLSTSNDEEDPTSLMTYDPLSEEMERMNVNERLSPAPQSDGSSSDEEPFWMKDEEFVVTADGEDTPATKVASIQSIMEPHIFLRRIDNETKKACTQVCKAWARWLYKMKQDGYDEEPSEGSGH